MAERRMFAKTIVDSDAFLEMPVTARLLYYDLGMRADDDGFVNNPKRLTRMIGATSEDMGELVKNGYIIPFDSGVIAIRHWRVNNYLQKDRCRETQYVEEKKMLVLDEKNVYMEAKTNPCIQKPAKMYTQDSLGEDRKVKFNNIYSAGASVYENFAGDDKELLTALLNFDEMRKQIKKPMTDRAREILIDKLKKAPEADRVQMLNNSIEHCWQTVYPLDRQKQTDGAKASYDKNRYMNKGVGLKYGGGT